MDEREFLVFRQKRDLNCAVRQAFNVQDPDTARLLSSMLGQRTVTALRGVFFLFGFARKGWKTRHCDSRACE